MTPTEYERTDQIFSPIKITTSKMQENRDFTKIKKGDIIAAKIKN